MLNLLLLALPLAASAGQTSDTLQFVTLAAGGSHSCGIAKSKATYCWGSNQYGQIGDGKRTGQQDPNKYPTLALACSAPRGAFRANAMSPSQSRMIRRPTYRRPTSRSSTFSASS